MAEFAADDREAVQAGIARIAQEREAARAYWCSCGHPGRMIVPNAEGYKICSACKAAVDE